jgi:hypothetical protein
MVTFDQLKDRFVMKAEKNGTNDSITTDNLRICLLLNESQNKFITLHLQQRGIDDVRYIQKFLVLDKKLSSSSKSQDKYNFKLPDDYFDLADVRAKAKKGSCTDSVNLYELQTENLNELLQDDFYKPSFEWREVPYTVNSDNLSFYTDNFSISEVLLNYYRYPNQIRLVNDENPESEFDKNFPIEWDDKSLDDIISLMVFNSDVNENNPRYQLQTLRTQK